MQHLELIKSHNTSLKFVSEQKQNDIIRSKKKLLESYLIECEENKTPKKLWKVFIMANKESKMIQWYSDAKIQCKSDAWVFWEKIKQDPGIDKPLRFLWEKDRYVTLEIENYLLAIQEQELPTK